MIAISRTALAEALALFGIDLSGAVAVHIGQSGVTICLGKPDAAGRLQPTVMRHLDWTESYPAGWLIPSTAQPAAPEEPTHA